MVRNKQFTLTSNRDLHYQRELIFFLSFFSLLNINPVLTGSNKVSIFRNCRFFLGYLFTFFSQIVVCHSNLHEKLLIFRKNHHFA